ncbi:hypothetical protein FQA39_LY09598 [Lamprigera yunnana]|nr:hypothetical protein FQA39_LY09598 [Lamprigera yunnana]
MRNFRFLCKRISIWIILTLQILLIASYFLLQTENPKAAEEANVRFITVGNTLPKQNKLTYHTIHSRIKLHQTESSQSFVDFNVSVCYKHGTDLTLMKKSKVVNWECKCLIGWHGTGCSQPEVIWRAFLSHRSPLSLRGPKKHARRIIYLFEVNEFTETTTEIRVSEFNNTVDLFVMYENKTNNYFEHKLQSGFLKDFHYKILYVQCSHLNNLWGTVKKSLVNLSEDDVVLISGLNDIPNSLALQYFKLYDKWPQPLLFRLRWSVYGFFWVHPNKTALRVGACSVSYLFDTLKDDITMLGNQKVNNMDKALVVGDLNHFGGWMCEYCYESSQLVLRAIENISNKQLISGDKVKIDNGYIEDLIENGVYVDDTTALLRTHRHQETYFAPPYVKENNWNLRLLYWSVILLAEENNKVTLY